MVTENKKVPQDLFPRGIAGRFALFFMNVGHKPIYTNMAKALDLEPEDDLLEIACGSGHFIRKYASQVRSVAGLDLSELCIKLATNKNKQRVAAGTAEFVQGEAAKLPWDDNKFSVVTAMASFLFLDKSLEILKEAYRVLRPGGRVVIGIEWHAEDGMDHSKEVKKYGVQLWKESDVRSVFQEAGFSDIDITYAQRSLRIPKMMIAGGKKKA
jgi:ubiquinone/menaquinone biosynthesis C-methylase UbiE